MILPFRIMSKFFTRFNTDYYMGGCQNYGPFWGPLKNTATSYLGCPKRGHNFDNHPRKVATLASWSNKYHIDFRIQGAFNGGLQPPIAGP